MFPERKVPLPHLRTHRASRTCFSPVAARCGMTGQRSASSPEPGDSFPASCAVHQIRCDDTPKAHGIVPECCVGSRNRSATFQKPCAASLKRYAASPERYVSIQKPCAAILTYCFHETYPFPLISVPFALSGGEGRDEGTPFFCPSPQQPQPSTRLAYA